MNWVINVWFKQGNTVKRPNWQNVERKFSRFAFSVHFRRFEGSGLRLNKLQDHHRTVPARSANSVQLLWRFWDIAGWEDSSGVEMNKLGVAMLWGETVGISVSLMRGIVHLSHISEVSIIAEILFWFSKLIYWNSKDQDPFNPPYHHSSHFLPFCSSLEFLLIHSPTLITKHKTQSSPSAPTQNSMIDTILVLQAPAARTSEKTSSISWGVAVGRLA